MTEDENLVSNVRTTRNRTRLEHFFLIGTPVLSHGHLSTTVLPPAYPVLRQEARSCVIPDRSRGSGLCGILIRVSGVPDRPTGRFSSETLL